MGIRGWEAYVRRRLDDIKPLPECVCVREMRLCIAHLRAVQRFGRCDRRALRRSQGNRRFSTARLSSRAKLPARQAGAEGWSGIAPTTAFSEARTQDSRFVNCLAPCLHTVCTDVALRELVAAWHLLTPTVSERIMGLARGTG